MVEESRTSNGIEGMADHLGVGEGQRYQRSRVTPVEGRALTTSEGGWAALSGDKVTYAAVPVVAGVLEKEERNGD